ncbi:C40 family peptidase [Saccharomonospora glauca]|uniref:Cell wall-associated hydrolase, invasion-associated protein n=1 Tax=Saccharomonospora glauca K62 TaxID=928724 RepID=I1CYF8_9PSEU|nr:C40 family peptidase [Saccharomonospora glauca]EIE97732.1 cell wall-associated hydrolase, invasion-associated protein [Saccharomonospora glauca K62]
MRVGLLFGFVAAATTTVLVAAGAAMVIDSQRQQVHAAPLSCNAALGPTQPGQQNRGANDAANLTDEQLNTVSLIITIGKERELSPRAWQIAIQAGMTESGLRNLDYGDRDSLGIFQMRPSMGWGSPEQITDPTYAVNKFYDVLESVPGWETMRPGDAAQAVERSAFPTRYHRWEPMAVHLVETLGEVSDATGCGPGMGAALPPNEQAAEAIEFALGEQGKPYVWGAEGPDAYDCSGLMQTAYEAAGITLPRVSRDQYRAGAMLPVEEAQPGDLVFWAYDSSDPATIHHVAMYLGGGKIVEAQQSGVPVHTRDFSFDEPGLVPQAVRPGV